VRCAAGSQESHCGGDRCGGMRTDLKGGMVYERAN
jgi:hypothetical protein